MIIWRRSANAAIIRKDGSRGPVNAAIPAYCADALTQEWQLMASRSAAAKIALGQTL
jgi:hypothetical protein